MPIYEYRCNTCGYELEVMQKLSDPELSGCPSCGRPELKKLISAVGFRLKGGGWYETDFKGGNQKNLAKGDSASASNAQAGASSDGGGETRPAPATTTG